MDYKITMLTVSQAIPTGSTSPATYAPWANSKAEITFQNPTLSTVTITDDDGALNSKYYMPGETQQTLTSATTFGYGSSAVTLPAGTKMSNFQASYLVDGSGNRFIVMFPRTYEGSSIGTEVGGRTSVLIFPQPKTDPVSGEVSYPTFSLTAKYHFDSVRVLASTRDGEAYPPQTPTPCFASGTMIDTIFGPRAIETLAVGDMIRTRDHGHRWLSWIGATHLDAARLDLQPNLRPIRIRAGALGNGAPARDLTVSPQHRILVRSSVARSLFGETEILVAAKHLVGLPGIEVIAPEAGVTYWHLLFDGHEVVLSDGAWSESLFTGPMAMESVGPAARREIFALFPQLADPAFRATGARRLLTGREGRKLAQHHARNGRLLVEGV